MNLAQLVFVNQGKNKKEYKTSKKSDKNEFKSDSISTNYTELDLHELALGESKQEPGISQVTVAKAALAESNETRAWHLPGHQYESLKKEQNDL